MQQKTANEPRPTFEEHLLDLHNYRKARRALTRPFKAYQLAQLQLLARWEQDREISTVYSTLYRKMRGFIFLPKILSRPSEQEIILPGRLWLLTKRLKKAGFEYNPTTRLWWYHYQKTK